MPCAALVKYKNILWNRQLHRYESEIEISEVLNVIGFSLWLRGVNSESRIHSIVAFQMCYRRMLRISRVERVTNNEVLAI